MVGPMGICPMRASCDKLKSGANSDSDVTGIASELKKAVPADKITHPLKSAFLRINSSVVHTALPASALYILLVEQQKILEFSHCLWESSLFGVVLHRWDSDKAERCHPQGLRCMTLASRITI
jgi:hypothetical protein